MGFLSLLAWHSGLPAEGPHDGLLAQWRIDGAIQVRSNVDPTFYSLVGSGRSGGDHHGSSLLENPYIPYQCMDSYLSSAGLGIVPFEPFFHAFPRGLEKAAINRIFLILPSRKEEREILFPFRLEMGAGLKKDLRVSRVRPVGSLNALFFLLIEVISQILPMVLHFIFPLRPNLNLRSRDSCPYTDKGCMDSREERSRGGPLRTARIPRVNRKLDLHWISPESPQTSPQEDRWGDSGEIQCRSNFLFTRGIRAVRRGPPRLLSSRESIHPLSVYGQLSLERRGLEKAAINRIFLILPSRKEEREILFPFRLEMGAEGGNKHTWRAQYNGELYAAFGKDESLPKRNLLILSQLVGP
uniref:Uncharacterized protein ycf68 n=1 Tax=Brassica oleracea var. oleracea TaxID=109376 RepID=A0A0D2ZV57_BRAOL